MATLTKSAAPVDALRRRPPWRTAAAIVAAVLLVLALLFGLLLAALSLVGPTDRKAHSSAPISVPLDTSQQTPAETGSSTSNTELALPQPTGYVAGVPVGFPHTEAGAVAAAYGYSRIATGLDVEATLGVLEAIADPGSRWFQQARSEIADGLVAQRKSLGLAAVGPSGTALINVSPSGYQLDRKADGSFTVRTLNVVSTESSNGTTGTGTIVFRWVLRWDEDRWVVAQTFIDEADAKLAVAPLTTDAQTKGWKAARGG